MYSEDRHELTKQEKEEEEFCKHFADFFPHSDWMRDPRHSTRQVWLAKVRRLDHELRMKVLARLWNTRVAKGEVRPVEFDAVLGEIRREERDAEKLVGYKHDPNAISWQEYVRTTDWAPKLRASEFVRTHLEHWRCGAPLRPELGEREPGEEG